MRARAPAAEPDAGANGAWDPLAAVIAAEPPAEARAAAAGGSEASAQARSGPVRPPGAPGGPPSADRGRGVAAPSGAGSRLGAVEEVQFTRLKDEATLPTRAHDSDAGLDLYAAEGARITPGGRVSVGTGLAVAIPDGLAGLVLPRSGLALKDGVTLVNSPGLIDPGYRGELRVLLLNTDLSAEFKVAAGDRVAQLLLVPVALATPLESDSLDSTARGVGGFGSSG